MDDRIEAQLGGKFELLAEEISLAQFVRFNLGRILRQMMVIEADLADGDHTPALRQGAEAFDGIVGSFVRLAGMNADRGPDVGEIFRELDRARAGIDPRADGDDLRHARIIRARDHFRTIRIVVGVIEVGVGVDEHEKFPVIPSLSSNQFICREKPFRN